MPDNSLALVVAVIVVAVLFDITNGFNDAANAIATVVSTRVLTPLAAVLMAAVMNFAGAYAGTAVAKTVGKGLVQPDGITLPAVLAAAAGAAIFVFAASRLGLPVSGSHSILSSLVGAAVAVGGWGVLIASGITKVLLAVVISPLLGFAIGFAIMLALSWAFRRSTPSRVGAWFGKLQILSAAAMAFSHGNNDAQKTMGIMALALFVYYGRTELIVDSWVIFVAASAMAAGTYFGGRRVIRTMGMQLVKMKPVNGFAAESAAAAVIELASRGGIPVSTTHVITSSIMGQGSTQRLSAVSWGVARRIVIGWVFTFPLCGFLGWSISRLTNALF